MALAARLTRIPLTAFVSGLGRCPQTMRPPRPPLITRVQTYASEGRSGFMSRRAKKATLKEKAMEPTTGRPFAIGQTAVIGASVVGLGGLCFYGLGLSNKAGALEQSIYWTEEIKQRIHSTYMYFAGSIGMTAMTAVAVTRSPKMMNLMMKNSWLAIGASLVAMIGSGIVCRSIPYKEGFGSKQLAWLVHSGIMGAVVAPICLLGGPILVRAAWYTAGVVGGLSCLAMCAPSDKFLNMGGPLAIGLGLVIAANLGGMFLPPTTALGAGLYSISMYGGLILFGMFLLYDTQKIIKVAETHPTYSERKYDPVNMSIGIYLDTLNIFIRIAMMLAGGGNRRK